MATNSKKNVRMTTKSGKTYKSTDNQVVGRKVSSGSVLKDAISNGENAKYNNSKNKKLTTLYGSK